MSKWLKVTFEDRVALGAKGYSPMLPPSRFHVWDGERLLAVSSGQFEPDDLRRLGYQFAAAPAMYDVLNEAIERIADVIEGDEQADDSDHALYDLREQMKAVRDAAEKGL